MESFWNFPNWKFSELSELEIFGIFQIANFWIFQVDIFFNFPNWQFLEFLKLQIFGIVQRCVIRFFYFQIYVLFLYLFKLFDHWKYMVTYKIGNLWNFIILEIRWCSKLENFESFLNFPNWKCSEFYEFDIFGIFQIGNFFNFPN